MPLSGVLKITPRFHRHIKASLEPLSGVIKAYAAHRNNRNPRSAYPPGQRNVYYRCFDGQRKLDHTTERLQGGFKMTMETGRNLEHTTERHQRGFKVPMETGSMCFPLASGQPGPAGTYQSVSRTAGPVPERLHGQPGRYQSVSRTAGLVPERLRTARSVPERLTDSQAGTRVSHGQSGRYQNVSRTAGPVPECLTDSRAGTRAVSRTAGLVPERLTDSRAGTRASHG